VGGEFCLQVESAAAERGVRAGVYFTRGPRDAWNYVRDLCARSDSAAAGLRFYACGGDGTLNEVVNGVMSAGGKAAVGFMPQGTGNDFINNFPRETGFMNIAAQMAGTPRSIDLLRAGDRYVINMCNAGFDAEVARRMEKIKTATPLRGSTLYTLALARCLFAGTGINLDLSIDRAVYSGRFLLLLAADGVSYGGGYFGAPQARIDDGYMDCCLVKHLSRPAMAALVPFFKQGRHVEMPLFRRVLTYVRARTMTFRSPRDVTLSLDGEIERVRSLTVSVAPRAISFLVPPPV
jgi:YegS/Rv2252/BmrU family lipid kinase